MSTSNRSQSHRTDNQILPKMHELFLSTIVPSSDIVRGVEILQGYCAMSPATITRRRLIWEGKTPKAFDKNFLNRPQPKEKAVQWRNLSEALSRQPYVVTLSYEINPSQFGKTDGDDAEK